jgi:glycosyltransferase involved in cell wall biosynthesis
MHTDAERLRILWVLPRPLVPLDAGGKIRTWNILRLLARGHEVTVIGLSPDGALDLVPREECGLFRRLVPVAWSEPRKGSVRFWLAVLANLGSRHAFVLSKYASSSLRHEIEQLVRAESYDVLVADFLQVTRSIPETGLPRVVFQHNVESMIRWRHAQSRAWGATRLYLLWEWVRMARWERRICREYEGVLAVSPEDAEYFRKEWGARRVWTVSTGVDAERFSMEGPRVEPADDLVFTGSMDWEANADGIGWFLDRVWPLILEVRPDTTLGVVGRNPPHWLVRVCQQAGGVTVTGRVPDVRVYMRGARVFIVPIRFGGGTRIKIYEAMAMGLPVVSTSIGAEGLGLEAGRHVLLADRPEAFAGSVVELLEDRNRAEFLAGQARKEVVEKRTWHHAARELESALQSVLRGG